MGISDVSERILCVLITGTSHAGKSTLAASIGNALGWPVVSTDKLARHPGRPWPTAPRYVAEYYSLLSDDAIYTFLLHHHANMWPGIQRLIRDHREQDAPLVLEGSALRPEYLATLDTSEACMVYLHSDSDFLRQRMYDQSRYHELDRGHQRIVDKFVDRSLRDNKETREAARLHGLLAIDVRDSDAVETFLDDVTRRLDRP